MPRLMSIAALGAMLATCGLGQTTFATLTGAVTDPNGSIIPGAIVEATQVGSNYRYTTDLQRPQQDFFHFCFRDLFVVKITGNV